MHPILFHLGPIPIKSFGLMVAVSMLVAIAVGKQLAQKDGVSPAHAESLSFWAIVIGMIGARLLYTFGENGTYYWRHPLEFFAFHTGGISYLGSFIFGTGTAIWYCRRKSLDFWQMSDVLCPGIALALSIGKIGCFLAGCCYGSPCNLPWAVTFNNADTLAEPPHVPLHPTQIYESLTWLVLFFVLRSYFFRRKYYGEVLAAHCVLFGIVRFGLEFLRGEPRMFGSISIHQALSLAVALAGAICWGLIRTGKLSRIR